MIVFPTVGATVSNNFKRGAFIMKRKFLWRKSLSLFAGTVIFVSALAGNTTNALGINYDTIPDDGLVYDFTDGAGEWAASGSTCTLTNENGAMKAVAKTNNYNDCAVRSGFIQVTPGAKYEISFRVVSTDIKFTNENDRIYIRIRGYNIDKQKHIDGENSDIYTSELFRETGVIRTTFTAKEKDEGIQIYAGFTDATAGETMVFDDVKIVKKSEIERWTLMNENDGNAEFSTETDTEKGEVLHAYRRGTGTKTDVGVAIRDIGGLTAGKSYTLSYDLKTDNSASGFVQELIWNAGEYGEASPSDEYLYGPSWRNTNGVWQRYTLNFTALKDTVAVRFLIGSTGGALDRDYNAYIGNVSVTEYAPDAKAPYGGTVAGWVTDGSFPTLSLSSKYSQDGDGYSALFKADFNTNPTTFSQYRFAPLLTAGTYKLSFYVMSDADNGTANVTVNTYDAPGTLINSVGTPLDNKWHLREAEFTVAEGSTLGRLCFEVWGDADCYIDNITLIKDGENYITNGNFCTTASSEFIATKDYSNPGGIYGGVVNGIASDSDKGYFCLSSKGALTAQGDTTYMQYIYLNKTLQTGSQYTVSFEATAADNDCIIGMALENGQYPVDNAAIARSTNWQTVSVNFTPADEGKCRDYVYLYVPGWKNCSQFVYVKNFSIKDSDGNEYVKNTDFMSNEVSDKNYCDTPSFNPQTVVLRGDANVDGKIDIRDLITLKKQLAQSVEITAFYNSDVDNSKAVTASDLAVLRQILLEVRFVR